MTKITTKIVFFPTKRFEKKRAIHEIMILQNCITFLWLNFIQYQSDKMADFFVLKLYFQTLTPNTVVQFQIISFI